MDKRTDKNGFSTKVTHLGRGKYGARVLQKGRVIFERNGLTKGEVEGALKDMLRMTDKCFDSPMADASRTRRWPNKGRPTMNRGGTI